MSDGSVILSDSTSFSFPLRSSIRDSTYSLPHFMLQQFLPPISGSEKDQSQSSGAVMTIINFNLLPGGISKDFQRRKTNLNRRFSDTVLESIKLLLNAALIRKESLLETKAGSEKNEIGKSERTKLQTLMDSVDEIRKSDGIMMGGFFPQLVARKSPGP